MNRTPFATAAVSSSTLQQGLFLMLAVLVTLLGCMTYQRLTQAPEPLLRPMTHTLGSHFSPVGNQSMQAFSSRRIEPAAEVDAPAPQQQRWTF